ncbi:MAG: hypothetical protein JRF69_13340 [Deltaproteobacteria bacterium]|nr:hypothetical protein [Deltaproteobacteria bacterium]
MSLKMEKVLLYGFLVTLILLFHSPVSFSEELESLGDVDEIQIHGSVDGNELTVRLSYKNRELDRNVYWVGGKVICRCQVYEAKGNKSIPEKGGLITGPPRMTVVTSNERLTIEIPEQHLGPDKTGIVECRFDTGHGFLTSTSDAFELQSWR